MRYMLIASALWLGACVTDERTAQAKCPGLKPDHVMTADFFDYSGLKFKYEKSERLNNSVHFNDYNYASENEADELLYSVGVSFSPAGNILGQAEFEAAKREAQLQDDYHKIPDIGLRAISEPVLFGPGGASSVTVFTSNDGVYDVRVGVHESGKGGMEQPLTAPLVAELISLSIDNCD